MTPPHDPGRILIFRALQLGDLLCSVPALRHLRAAWPGAALTLCSLPWAEAFAARYDDVFDDFVAFPGFPGMPERPCDVAAWPAFLADVQGRRFDLVVQLHGSGWLSNLVCALFGGRSVAGFLPPGQRPPVGASPDDFLPYPEDLSETGRLLALARHLTGRAALAPASPDFPVRPDDERALAAALGDALPRGPYVCLHPGARDPARRWPPACFAAVGRALAAAGYRIVLTGSAWETELTTAVAGALGGACLDTAALDLPLGPLAALLARARLVVCNDTGVSHLTAALGVPRVVVFLASDPARWAVDAGAPHRVVHGGAPDSVAAALAAVDHLGAYGLHPEGMN